jgi:transposase
VFVRPLAPAEGQRLKRLSRQAKHASARQRAAILLASATAMSAREIAEMWMTDESHVRKVIHEFNQHGFASLRPRLGGGRPRRISTEDEARIVALAGARPETLGVPLTRWSLHKLAEYLRGQGISVSPAHVSRILAHHGLSFQRTRSWKASPDPEYEQKAARVLALYREPPADGVVISFDEMGPVSLCPHQGRGWTRRRRPERHRATYTRRSGVRYLVGALDVHASYLRARLRPRRDGASTLTFMKTIRLAYPRSTCIYWIQDNLSCHWTPAIRAWAEESNVELVPTPTYASYLNRTRPLPPDPRVRL